MTEQSADFTLFFHGTSVAFALEFLHGHPLDVAIAASARVHGGPPGFYLSTVQADAEHFAAYRDPGAVIGFSLSSLALARLVEAGAVQRPIPGGKKSPLFFGDELYVPTTAFATFNTLQQTDDIKVVIVP
jgi:hypothetical protein